ncbi:hypothetical protein [Roseivivax isoporae]|uniref:Uncharacterized protein n=1 Tax=Roseivivax isoporae LMG 25204 TaxID=1449351 RepID=X7F785_9RHOB|nr:hypothetical protein [Roseivivax isoporae]ETX28792.1 hypothetical protein RISW2_04640 [Roseivivax isoporae LMG 25204]
MALLAQYEAILRRKAQAAAFSLTGIVFLGLGTVFLTAALWMVLAELRDPKFAAQVIGAGFVALGFLFLGIGRIIGRRRVVVAPVTTGAAVALPIAQIVEGFVLGMNAGRRTRRGRGSDRDRD